MNIIDGKDITGPITGKETKISHQALFFYHYKELEGARSAEWKYFRCNYEDLIDIRK